jgi:hypothetical protein
MSPVKMFTTAVCPYCVRAKQLLKARGVEHIATHRRSVGVCCSPSLAVSASAVAVLKVSTCRTTLLPLKGLCRAKRATGADCASCCAPRIILPLWQARMMQAENTRWRCWLGANEPGSLGQRLAWVRQETAPLRVSTLDVAPGSRDGALFWLFHGLGAPQMAGAQRGVTQRRRDEIAVLCLLSRGRSVLASAAGQAGPRAPLPLPARSAPAGREPYMHASI